MNLSTRSGATRSWATRLWVASLCGAIAPLLVAHTPAWANPRGFAGSYVGSVVNPSEFESSLQSVVLSGGSAAWLMEQAMNAGRPAPGQTTAPDTQFHGRLDLPNSPISLRGTLVLNQDIEAVMPSITYDLPLGSAANVYAGAGFAIVRPGAQTPLGDRDGVVITTGVEASVGRRVVVYGDVRYRPGPAAATENMQMQLGIGHRF
ncbi:hypothetical protein [Thermoleptolyngbya sp. M55_K2018_002]|uniref:hypothetical protein n=1 Tax=Thermoleptolyngbya sp. M55_K2018_002 TaxID=2747808 RepID=UPI0019E4ACA9|nr:hypothetical protein [Thermoleptolyngbya sp. M55_K2018_002]HIK42255.1 hypothetical protein [Thermoleptolyngbya sp. M55_K2018_002]